MLSYIMIPALIFFPVIQREIYLLRNVCHKIRYGFLDFVPFHEHSRSVATVSRAAFKPLVHRYWNGAEIANPRRNLCDCRGQA